TCSKGPSARLSGDRLIRRTPLPLSARYLTRALGSLVFRLGSFPGTGSFRLRGCALLVSTSSSERRFRAHSALLRRDKSREICTGCQELAELKAGARGCAFRSHKVLYSFGFLVLAVPLQPSVNRLAEIEWDLRPSPPEHTQYEVNRCKAQQHVMAKEKSVNKE